MSGYRMVVSAFIFDSRDSGAAWELRSQPPPNITREDGTIYHQLGKDQRSNSVVQFLLTVHHFRAIDQTRNDKLNHHKSETLCIGKIACAGEKRDMQKTGKSWMLQ